jgi:hypothetical protein
MASINPHRRPHYPPAERLAILELKAARGWSLEQTARVFHVTAPTIGSWLARLDDTKYRYWLDARESQSVRWTVAMNPKPNITRRLPHV